MFKSSLPLGVDLVADYQSVFINMATSEAAQRVAEQSEQAILRQLGEISEDTFLQPGEVNADWHAGLTRGSIDAHIKKAQATQLNKLSTSQLTEMIENNTKTYLNKKIRITSIKKEGKPFEAVWFGKHTGYRTSPYSGSVITGHIKEVLLDRNALIIKPLWPKHLLVPNLHLYVVYVISPKTLQPMVNISVLS